MSVKFIDGGITAPKGFKASAIHCGIKSGSNSEKPDLALISASVPCCAAGVFTRNKVKAAPVILTMQRLTDGHARAVIANSGNANACAPDDSENALKMASLAASELGIDVKDVAVASTGVIGQRLNIEAIENAVPTLVSSLRENGSDAAAAIMTTDTVKKEGAVSFEYGGKTVKIGGICKGSGMIHPNMGTLLCFLTTDAEIKPEPLKKALQKAVDLSFNRVSIDGDCSTNDSCIILASGLSEAAEITENSVIYELFCSALNELLISFARMLASDGEGASHLITCSIKNAPDEETAVKAGKAVIGSSLVKAAIFGADANVGRILCAMGYSGAEFELEKTDISFASSYGEIAVCKGGHCLSFDEELAKKVLTEHEIIINIDLHSGTADAVCWGCDLTYDYVRINGDYRS